MFKFVIKERKGREREKKKGEKEVRDGEKNKRRNGGGKKKEVKERNIQKINNDVRKEKTIEF